MEQRLIDVNALKAKVCGWFHKDSQESNEIDDLAASLLMELEKCSIIDPIHAAGACYCRECKHAYINVFSAMQGTALCKYWTNRSEGAQAVMPQDGFCSYGERGTPLTE